jgi:hypothetical protein
MVAGCASLLWPAVASACYLSQFYRPIMIPARMDFVIAMLYEPEDPATMVPGAELGIKLGSKAAIRPGAALCKYADWSTVVFGSAFGINIWNDAGGKVAIDAQTGVSYYSKDGESDMVIPVGAIATFKTSDKVSLYGGAALQLDRFKVDLGGGQGSVSESDSDPLLHGGVVFRMTSVDLIGGLVMKMGEGGSDMLFNLAARILLGK